MRRGLRQGDVCSSIFKKSLSAFLLSGGEFEGGESHDYSYSFKQIKEDVMFIRRKKVIMTALAAAAAVFVLVTQIGASGGTAAAGKAGEFPAFIPMPGVSPRGVAVDKVGNVYVSVGEGPSEI